MEFLLSEHVQKEVDGVVAHLACTSLSVERRHQLVKKAEAQKVLSLASASRNGVIQAYRRHRGSFLDKRIRDLRQVQKMKFMNCRALAVQKKPDLFGRARGSLWWEEGVSARSRKDHA